MDRLVALAPALLLLVSMVLSIGIYAALRASGRGPKLKQVKHNQIFGPFLAGWLVWFLSPFERFLLNRVTPNTITMISLFVCFVTGASVALGGIALAVFLYGVAGILDVLDGRIARLSGKQTTSGALLDSVSDRWGELFALCGYVWFLRDSAWMMAALATISGSLMVSYTRARAESLGVQSAGGLMQRAERVVLVAIGTLVASCFPVGHEAVAPILGGTLLVCGAMSMATAINRFLLAYKALEQREAAKVAAAKATPSNGLPVVPAGLRVTPHG